MGGFFGKVVKMSEEKATFLGHVLWISEKPVEGSWKCWIEGPKPVRHQERFESPEAAKQAVHHLAHWHLEGKSECDCPPDAIQWTSAL